MKWKEKSFPNVQCDKRQCFADLGISVMLKRHFGGNMSYTFIRE